MGEVINGRPAGIDPDAAGVYGPEFLVLAAERIVKAYHGPFIIATPSVEKKVGI